MGRKQEADAYQPSVDSVIVDHKRDDAILRLGRKLVAELGSERTADTLARWMAHDIAELMHQAEHAKGSEMQAARADCRDAILALWQHRAGAPGRLSRMGTLEGWTRLLRSRNNPWMSHVKGKACGVEGESTSEAEACLAMVSQLQTVADPLIRAALHIAAQTTDPTVKEEAELAALAGLENDEVKISRILFRWSESKETRTVEIRAEVEKAVNHFNSIADTILSAFERLSTEEVASDDQIAPNKKDGV